MSPVEVTLPLRLGSPQNGSHGHWATHAAARKKERLTASWRCYGPLTECRLSLLEGEVSRLTVVIARIAPRSLDDDNLRSGCKSVRDGITDALGLKNDRDSRLSWEYEQQKGPPKHYAVRITVRAT